MLYGVKRGHIHYRAERKKKRGWQRSQPLGLHGVLPVYCEIDRKNQFVAPAQAGAEEMVGMRWTLDSGLRWNDGGAECALGPGAM